MTSFESYLNFEGCQNRLKLSICGHGQQLGNLQTGPL